jgi:hypothetical protein
MMCFETFLRFEESLLWACLDDIERIGKEEMWMEKEKEKEKDPGLPENEQSRYMD